MNDTQLERVLCYAQAGWFDSNIDPVALDPAFMSAEADLAAMRQPITAEALVQAGWETTSREEYDDSANAYYQRWIPPDTRAGNYWLSVEWFAEMEDEPEKIRAILHGEDDEVVLPNVTTMYQLGQLVELLGGAK